jgi:hypothetical protein
MKIIFRFLLFAGLCSGLACGGTPALEKTEANYPVIFEKVLEAHGGEEVWDKMNTLTFTRGSGDNAEKHTIDLKSRKSLIEVEGKYKLGSDGAKVWVTPHRDSFPGKSPRFTHNLHFYFFAIPFVFTDPGVVLSDGGKVIVDSMEYQIVNARFKENIGDAPEDQYNMYVNPKTNIIDFITYSVTFFDESRATSYNALKYEWEKVYGLLVPQQYIGYKWEDDTFGDQRYESQFKNTSYKMTAPSKDIFAVPEGAYTE